MTTLPGDPDYLTMSNEGPWCVKKDAGGYVCTRPPGHDGDHAAHTYTGEQVSRWPRKGSRTQEAA